MVSSGTYKDSKTQTKIVNLKAAQLLFNGNFTL